jgi:hypothetical protein
MIILDTLLIGSLRFVLDKIAVAAEAELDDEQALKERLLEAEMQLELGEISEADFAALERDVLARIREIRGDTGRALSTSRGRKIGIEATIAPELDDR